MISNDKIFTLQYSDDSSNAELPLEVCPTVSSLYYYSPEAVAKHVCVLCGCCFASPSSLGEHQRDCCQNRAKQQQQQQQQHRQQQQQFETRFPCFICKKVYLSRTSLSRHRRANCPGARLAICGICDREFPNHDVMMLHREEHFHDKPSI
ncbi:hypothetical protein TKK_0011299 [Trichogramma kaykai]